LSNGEEEKHANIELMTKTSSRVNNEDMSDEETYNEVSSELSHDELEAYLNELFEAKR